jgi:hypothetical protein
MLSLSALFTLALLAAPAPVDTTLPPPLAPAEPVAATPLNPALPTLFIAGDSTAANQSRTPTIQGWGTPFREYFDPRTGAGLGGEGFSWTGTKTVTNKREWPDWTPPSDMLKRRPDLPRHMEGGIENPLGARALYLGSSLYRIHGSNEPETIGAAVSSGCIRMTNRDVTDLYGRVKMGAQVIVQR